VVVIKEVHQIQLTHEEALNNRKMVFHLNHQVINQVMVKEAKTPWTKWEDMVNHNISTHHHNSLDKPPEETFLQQVPTSIKTQWVVDNLQTCQTLFYN